MIARLGEPSAGLHFHTPGIVDVHVEIVLAHFDIDPVVGRLVAGLEFGLFAHLDSPPCAAAGAGVQAASPL
jgi:hypothetical protein